MPPPTGVVEPGRAGIGRPASDAGEVAAATKPGQPAPQRTPLPVMAVNRLATSLLLLTLAVASAAEIKGFCCGIVITDGTPAAGALVAAGLDLVLVAGGMVVVEATRR